MARARNSTGRRGIAIRGPSRSSGLGWSVSEFALHHVALQVALTLAFAASGGFGGITGKLALVLLLASWGALLAHYWNGRRAGEIVEAAALVRSILEPADTLALLAVMRSDPVTKLCS